jgi:NADPH-dependent 2,4-dienoyl-CoA reductase/sulfur reductase-like enzyme
VSLSLSLRDGYSLRGFRLNFESTFWVRFFLYVRKKTMSQTIGSVMVVGGGIAGMQAALDLADSGFFVHLVERSSSIGGIMSQLDKTFPTNDCAM